jgi:HpiC1 cyclase
MPTFAQRIQVVSVALLLSLGLGTAARAITVPVANPGFEADVLPPGGISYTIIDWDTSPGGGDGAFRPGADAYPGGVPEGQNVAYANLPGNRVRQVLTTLLEPNTTYRLQVEIGRRDQHPFAGYIVQLRAGGLVLAEDDSSLLPAPGTFMTSTVQYTSGASDPQLGTPLEIYLTAPGVQANFDDERLSATSAHTVCAESLLVPYYRVDKTDPSGTGTLFAVRNLTGDPVSAEIEYFQRDGTGQRKDALALDPYQTTMVAIRDVAGWRSTSTAPLAAS